MPSSKMPNPDKPCYVYMIECRGGLIYVGSAQDVEVRYERHCTGNGAFFTKLNPPVQLLACKEFSSRQEAVQEEKRLKKLKYWEKLAWCRKLWRETGLEPSFE